MWAGCVFGILAATAVLAAQSTPADLPQLEGYLTVGGNAMFNFVVPPDGKTKWVSLGDSVNGYTVQSYNSKTHTLILVKSAQPFEQQLSEGRIQEKKIFSREEALAYFDTLIETVEEKAKHFATYRPLPENDFSLWVAKVGEVVVRRQKELSENRGEGLFVTKAADGLPLVIHALPLDFVRLPSGLTANLPSDDRASLNERYLQAQLLLSYNSYLAHSAAGDIRPRNDAAGLTPPH
jgi:hypothetical protein